MISKLSKFTITVATLIILLVVLTGCDSDKKEEKNSTSTNNTTISNTTSNNNTMVGAKPDMISNEISNTTIKNETKKERIVDTIDYKSAANKQMSKPEKGETIAIFHIKNFGDVKVKFFEEVAPKAVENFVTHAKNGYYDGLTFHRVINEFMIQGGDPEGTGRGGESIWGKGFGVELAYDLVPYRGSLCMAMSSLPNSIGSQFFITQAHYNETMEKYLTQGGYPEKLIEEYREYGGYLSLYLHYTVFGQVFEGIEVIDKVAAVEKDASDKPLEDVIIESIEVTTY